MELNMEPKMEVNVELNVKPNVELIMVLRTFFYSEIESNQSNLDCSGI